MGPRVVLPAAALLLLLAGCSSRIGISREAIGGDRGCLALWVEPGSGDLGFAEGYVFKVTGSDDSDPHRPSRGDGPVHVPDLPPGAYQVTLSGRGIRPVLVEVKVGAGEQVSVSFREDKLKPERSPQEQAERAVAAAMVIEGILGAMEILAWIGVVVLEAAASAAR